MPRRMHQAPPSRRIVAAVLTASVAVAGCSSGDAQDQPGVAAPAAPALRPPIFTVVDVPPAQVHRVAVEGQGRAVSLVRSSAATWLAEPPTPETAVSLIAE